VDIADYRTMIEGIIATADQSPATLLEPLESKMRRLASERRFEEAAQMRDRHRALAKALERQRAWRTLGQAGRIELESLEGDRVVIDQGILTAAWGNNQQPPLISTGPLPEPGLVPPTVAAAEEAHLIWRWMTAGHVIIIDSSGPLVMPSSPIPHLRAA
jgi:DNA polymerase-3 subunit epsilon